MLTKILAVIFLLAAYAAPAQVASRAAFFGQFFSSGTGAGLGDYGSVITNISVPVAWYPVSANYGSGAGEGLTNRGNWALPQLTNVTAPTLVSGGLNGLDYLDFDGSTTALGSVDFTSGVYNFEVFMVMAYTNIGTAQQYYFSSSGTNTGKSVRFTLSTSLLNAFENQPSGVLGTSNTWVLYDFVFGRSSTSSGMMIYTNGIVASASMVNATTNPLSALRVGAANGFGTKGKAAIAELVICQTNLSTLESTVGAFTADVNRSNITWALTNKYGIH